MGARFHHSPEVIKAARELARLMVEESPYGNTREAEGWAEAYIPTVFAIARQELEEKA